MTSSGEETKPETHPRARTLGRKRRTGATALVDADGLPGAGDQIGTSNTSLPSSVPPVPPRAAAETSDRATVHVPDILTASTDAAGDLARGSAAAEAIEVVGHAGDAAKSEFDLLGPGATKPTTGRPGEGPGEGTAASFEIDASELAASLSQEDPRPLQIKPTQRGAAAPLKSDLPDDSDDDPSFPTSVYVLPRARAKAKATQKREGLLYASIAMDAIDLALQSGMLEALVANRKVIPRPEDSRFPNRAATRRARRRSTETTGSRVLWQLSFTASELETLDIIQAEVGASSRSELISVAVEWHFLGTELNDTGQDTEIDLDIR